MPSGEQLSERNRRYSCLDDRHVGAEVSDGNMTPLERKAPRIVVAADRDSDLLECDAVS